MSTTTPPRYDEYRRVSRVNGRNGDNFLSPELQRTKIAQWAALRGVEIAEHESDLDQSGGKLSRPVFNAILERIRRGESDGIVVAKLDRFSRAGVADALVLIESIIKAGGKVASVEEGIDPTTPTGEFTMTLFLALARMQRRQLADGWEQSRTRAVDRGAFIGKAPLGYRRGAGGVLERDPETADLMRAAYRIAASAGLTAAAQVLASALPDQRWDAFTVRRLLSSRVYLGESSHGAAVNSSAHKSLVPLNLWLKANSEPAQGRARSLEYPLSGIARCECGGALVGQRGHQRADGSVPRRYRCSAVNSGAKAADHVSLMAEPLETFVTDALLDWLLEVELPDNSDEVAELERQLEVAETARLAFVRDLELERSLGPEAFRAGALARSAEVERLQAELARATRATATEDWIDAVVEAGGNRDNPELLRRAIGRLITRVDVAHGRVDLDRRVNVAFTDAGSRARA
ncbi:MAG TPA: recombinase family protein [Solirubrobacteraceae bacterium]|jgi:DNA invertase Pin-like site-specific DNA recombinase|nr:recombinase family protein [Solirubrobacteraceae bacterium]